MSSAMSSRRTKPKSNDLVDFDNLVWPPPELRPPPTPTPILVHGSGGKTYKVYPGQSLAEARRLAKLEQTGPVPLHAPIPRAPLNPASLQAISQQRPQSAVDHASLKNKSRYGCKDFPAGYSPTPRPASPTEPPNASQSQSSFSKSYPQPARSASRPAQPQPYHHASVPQPTPQRAAPASFFEPVEAVPRPYDPTMLTEDFISPVVENGRVVSHCHISGKTGLTPGGVVEKGWSQSGSGGYSAAGLTPSPLKYADHVEPPSPYSSAPQRSHRYRSPNPNPHPQSHPQSQSHPQTPSETPIRPTRIGYWNRRGDTVSPDGRLIPAPPSQVYPPDLAHYPRYALLNEHGQTFFFDSGEDRVALWRSL